ncbi:S1 RNA-binding domain-containing protein [Bacillus toyonensis]|uniref:S1 RNA-binding domain-containing protein n=1 Tax=Bacillus toyonensis TaxID=155322 RepID=UPI002E21B276|nr:S1 RNA-binding domain-containing protein [Bacillus toyonensis]MED2737323.1 S1 RNA-binding domain-containing protein [Bacillus toyonensis]
MEEKWIPSLIKIIDEKMASGGLKRGELSKICKELATEYDENIEKIRNYYYRVLKPKPVKETANKETSKEHIVTSEEKDKQVIVKAKNKQASKENPKKNEGFKKHRIYPADVYYINSYISLTTHKEWLSVKDVNRNISGKLFEDYLSNIEHGEFVSTYKTDNKEVSIMEKEHLRKQLKAFSGFTRSNNASRAATYLCYLLESSDEEIEKQRIKKIFETLNYGEVVEVEVQKIMQYGAIVNLTSEPNISGMIYIGEIANDFVNDVSKYFKEKQILKAKILEKKSDGKLALSTKSFDITPIVTEKNGEESLEAKNEIASTKEESKHNDSFSTEPENKQENTIETNKIFITSEESSSNSEWNEIIKFLKTIVGPLSPDAKNKLQELIKKHGIFNFTMGINKESVNFRNDFGWLLLEKVEELLKTSLSNSIEYKVGSGPHPVEAYMERANRNFLNMIDAERELLNRLNDSKIIIETSSHRYIENDGLIFPCIKTEEGGKTIYINKTTLTRNMLKDYFDKMLEKYEI